MANFNDQLNGSLLKGLQQVKTMVAGLARFLQQKEANAVVVNRSIFQENPVASEVGAAVDSSASSHIPE